MKAQLINTIQPKELLLVRTKSVFADSYAKLLRSKLPGLEVYFPGLNEIIDATKERHIYQLKLKDSLLNNLNFVKVGHFMETFKKFDNSCETCHIATKYSYRIKNNVVLMFNYIYHLFV